MTRYETPLGSLVRKRRAILGLSLRRCAERGNIAYSTIQGVERGLITNPTARTIAGLAHGIGLPQAVVLQEAVRTSQWRPR